MHLIIKTVQQHLHYHCYSNYIHKTFSLKNLFRMSDTPCSSICNMIQSWYVCPETRVHIKKPLKKQSEWQVKLQQKLLLRWWHDLCFLYIQKKIEKLKNDKYNLWFRRSNNWDYINDCVFNLVNLSGYIKRG